MPKRAFHMVWISDAILWLWQARHRSLAVVSSSELEERVRKNVFSKNKGRCRNDCADCENICTIPTSGNILPCLLATTAQPFWLFSFPFAPTGTALQFTHLSALLTVLYLPFPQSLSLQIACYPIYFAVH